MTNLEQFKCPACGGSVEFDAGTQKMKCPYCGSEFDVEAIREQETVASEQGDSIEWQAAGGEWQEGETDGMRVYTCQSCGGEIIGDETLGSTSCPYCGNQVVMTGQFSGALRPDCIIPFKFDKKAARQNFEKFVRSREYVPKQFKTDKHIDEIKGVYVPVWLFDGEADASMQMEGIKIRVWEDSVYSYTESRHYDVRRAGHVSFKDIPVDGSEKLDDELMESIEPFYSKDAVDFSTAYLSGYLADKYDVDEKQSEARANERIRHSAREALEMTVKGYTELNGELTSIDLNRGRAKYALYPVWLLSATYKGQAYTFAMNGQTGKYAGDLPVDEGGLWKYFGISTLGWTIAIYGLLMLLKFFV